MIFNKHSELEGKHAFLSPSKPAWLNYDAEKLLEKFDGAMTAQRGTELHFYAHMAIQLGIKQANTHQTMNMYVNDCIGYRMQTEQKLKYSHLAFGSADAIDFRDNLLRIFDLKNGVTAASDRQLKIYAALFCLEYDIRPMTIGYDLRIYQNDEVEEIDTDPEEIAYIMDVIIQWDKLLKASELELR